MKTVTYTCDECGLPIDGKEGPPSSHSIVGGETLCELFWQGTMGDNRFSEPRHYHRWPCFNAVVGRIINEK